VVALALLRVTRRVGVVREDATLTSGVLRLLVSARLNATAGLGEAFSAADCRLRLLRRRHDAGCGFAVGVAGVGVGVGAAGVMMPGVGVAERESSMDADVHDRGAEAGAGQVALSVDGAHTTVGISAPTAGALGCAGGPTRVAAKQTTLRGASETTLGSRGRGDIQVDGVLVAAE
jgi:hypothetical protein